MSNKLKGKGAMAVNELEGEEDWFVGKGLVMDVDVDVAVDLNVDVGVTLDADMCGRKKKLHTERQE